MRKRDLFSVFLLIAFSLLLVSWVTAKNQPPTSLTVIPDKTVLSPALIKKPIQFKGSGFQPHEIVIIEMVLPPGLKIKGIEEGENVGLAYTNADDQGNFSASMAPTATLNWFFQVGWSSNLTPNFKEARPIPPGKYDILVTGTSTDLIAKAVLELLPPPKKKK